MIAGELYTDLVEYPDRHCLGNPLDSDTSGRSPVAPKAMRESTRSIPGSPSLTGRLELRLPSTQDHFQLEGHSDAGSIGTNWDLEAQDTYVGHPPAQARRESTLGMPNSPSPAGALESCSSYQYPFKMLPSTRDRSTQATAFKMNHLVSEGVLLRRSFRQSNCCAP